MGAGICIICQYLLPAENEEVVRVLHDGQDPDPAIHLFDRECLNQWHERNADCPICRRVIREIVPYRPNDAIESWPSTFRRYARRISRLFTSVNQAVHRLPRPQDAVDFVHRMQDYVAPLPGDLLANAVEEGDTDRVNELLDIHAPRITSQDIDHALLRAAHNGFLGPFTSLMRFGRASSAAIGQALIIAASSNHQNIVQLIINMHIPISEMDRGAAALGALVNHHGNISELLLNSGRISTHYAIQFLMNQNLNGSSEIIRLVLINNTDIPQMTIDDAFETAVGQGRRDIIRIMAQSGTISAVALRQAKRIGRRYNDEEINTILRQARARPRGDIRIPINFAHAAAPHIGGFAERLILTGLGLFTIYAAISMARFID